ncbi:MAG: HEPN domain-containing protein [Spirochaetaceae bacterium]|nr:HEPN domain-containing protein [Spirochaetaceae bacterium]
MHEDDVKEWLRFANMDLDTANHLFNTMYPKPYEIICYHCQQSEEKNANTWNIS